MNLWLAPVALVLLAASAWALWSEARPFIGGAVPPAGLSIASQNRAMTACIERTTSVRGRLQPADDRASVLHACRAEANRIVAHAPTHALAWTAGAAFAEAAGDEAGMLAGLRWSRIAAPNAAWLAPLRMRLGERHLSALTGEDLLAHDRDLQLLAGGRRGAVTLAGRWIRDQAFRSRILPLLEQLPGLDQQRFLSEVERRTLPQAPRDR